MLDLSTPTTTRRRFLAGTLAAASLALLDPRQLAQARARAALLAPGDLFPLGVASGDPTSSSLIIWTRLISPDAGDPLPAADVAVDWEVATDAAFASVVASGTAPAVAALAHSVHVDVDGLDPDVEHWYRFTADGRTSPVGRGRTFPGAGASPAQVRFGVATCQNWSAGYYSAYENMAAEDLDFVVFVGDYIYERSSSSGPRPISLPESVDLPTYRARYELYKGDASLQAAHQRFAWIITMDDHEVANNAIGDLGKDGMEAGNPAGIVAWRARRADAFQAWYEHQPLRLAAPGGADWTIYRSIEHSDLLRFYVLDGRQYRTPYPAEESQGADTPARFDESQSMLGATQEAWLDARFAETTSHWNVVAQQTVMTAMPIPAGDTTFFNFDQWDGYVAARNRLLQSLVDNQVRNPMILSGDIHLAAAAAVRLDFDDPDAPDIANEIVTTSISSSFVGELLPLVQAALDGAPWAKYANGADRGYAVCTVTPERFVTDFRVVATTLQPTSTVSTDYTDVVLDRDPVAPVPPTEPTVPVEPTDPVAPGTAVPATPVPGAANYTG